MAETEQQMAIPTEFLTLSGIPTHELRLKINAPIMLLRNMNPKYGHCNGTRYIVTAIHGARLIEAKIIGGDHAGNSILIPRIPIQPSKGASSLCDVFLHDGEQKSGGKFQTCGRISTEPLFTHGQLYVAASRVGDPKAIRFVISQDATNR